MVSFSFQSSLVLFLWPLTTFRNILRILDQEGLDDLKFDEMLAGDNEFGAKPIAKSFNANRYSSHPSNHNLLIKPSNISCFLRTLVDSSEILFYIFMMK